MLIKYYISVIMIYYGDLTDQELSSLLQHGDGVAYTEIYNRYKGVLYIHALRLIKDSDEAEDIIHELFAVLWEKSALLNLQKPLAAYLYNSVKNRVLDKLAHKKLADHYLDSLQEIITGGVYITDEQLREKELRLLIEREVTLLPKKMREVFELSRNEHLSHREIAEKLNISEKTVKKQINNALKLIRVKLNIFILFSFFL